MILSGGKKVSLIEVDDELLMSDLVADGDTVGVSHGHFATVAATLIVSKDLGLNETELTEEMDAH